MYIFGSEDDILNIFYIVGVRRVSNIHNVRAVY